MHHIAAILLKLFRLCKFVRGKRPKWEITWKSKRNTSHLNTKRFSVLAFASACDVNVMRSTLSYIKYNIHLQALALAYFLAWACCYDYHHSTKAFAIHTHTHIAHKHTRIAHIIFKYTNIRWLERQRRKDEKNSGYPWRQLMCFQLVLSNDKFIHCRSECAS